MSSSSSSSSPPEMVVKNRFLGFLIWQSISSAAVFLLFKTLLLSSPTASPTPSSSSSSSLIGLLAFLSFQLSQLLFSVWLSIVSSSQPDRPASPFELALGLLRFILASADFPPEFRRRAKVSLAFVLFVTAAGLSGFVCAVSLDSDALFDGRLNVGIRGLGCGLLYGVLYVYKRRWVLVFPIIQRPPFFSFKMGLPSAITRAFKLSGAAYLFSAVLGLFLPDQFKSQVTVRKFIAKEIIFYFGTFVVFLCWELSHHIYQVLHTKRFVFAPPKGSAAAETNPTEPLLATLEESIPSSLLQFLAYLDLCMVCENNVDTWRRAAFFEETGETYKRVVAVCLSPLEQFASKLGEGLESCYIDETYQLSSQLQLPTDSKADSKCYEQLNNFQLCAWSARTIASLTARSHTEDRFGVAQLSGSNATVISMLISCLLAVEAFMGKKTKLHSPHLMGPAGIKWATLSTGRKDIAMGKKRGGPLYSKAYAMADVLRTSIYCVVSAFHNEMATSAKAGFLEKDWLISGKPRFGSREILLQKLCLFLDFRA